MRTPESRMPQEEHSDVASVSKDGRCDGCLLFDSLLLFDVGYD